MSILNDFVVGVNQALFPNQTTPQQLSQNQQMLSEQTQNCNQLFGRAPLAEAIDSNNYNTENVFRIEKLA